jgi:hypothetical protein
MNTTINLPTYFPKTKMLMWFSSVNFASPLIVGNPIMPKIVTEPAKQLPPLPGYESEAKAIPQSGCQSDRPTLPNKTADR